MTASSTQTIGERVTQARRDAGLNRMELAMKIGVSLRTVDSYERDERARGIPFSKLMVIARVTGKPLSFFVEEVAA